MKLCFVSVNGRREPYLLDEPRTCLRVQITKLLIMQLFQPPVTSPLFGSNILLSILFSNTLSLYSSLSDKDHVSHPYRTKGKIIVVNIITFTF
jgi:hypothetical protein